MQGRANKTNLMHKQIKQFFIIPIIMMMGISEQAHGGMLSLDGTYPSIVTGIVNGNTNYFILVDPDYASTNGVAFSSSVTVTYGDVSAYLWSFQDGNPGSSSDDSPGTVFFQNLTYGQSDLVQVALEHDVGTNACTTITSVETNVDHSGTTNYDTITNWIYNINVEVPTFTFNNESTTVVGQFYIKKGWTLVNNMIPVNSDVTIGIKGIPSLDMSSVDAIDSDNGYWSLSPGSGSTDQYGNFATKISSSSSTTDVTSFI